MVIEVDVVVDQSSCFLKSGSLVSVNALSLENGEEIFGHSIVVAISPELSHILESGQSMLERCTDSPGRCGAATLQRLSFPFA